MDSIIQSFGLDNSYFVQLGLFLITFVVLSKIYFKPFQKLFDLRHQRTVEDRKAAEKMMAEAEAKLKEYQERLTEARLQAREEFDKNLDEAKAQEHKILNEAREEIKALTQKTLAEAQSTKEALRSELKADVDKIADEVTQKLLVEK